MAVFPSLSFAHPGRTAADGCHYCRTNCDKWGVPWNERHCHNGGASAPVEQKGPIYIPPTRYAPPPTDIPTPTKRPTSKTIRTVKPKKAPSIVPAQRLIQEDTNINGLLGWLLSLFK